MAFIKWTGFRIGSVDWKREIAERIRARDGGGAGIARQGD